MWSFKDVTDTGKGDEEILSFEAFVATRQVALLRFAMVLTGNARLAEDVVADVLSRAYERWDQLATMNSPYGYVRRMVVNEYLTWRRRLRRTFPVATLEELTEAAPDHAEAHSTRADLHARLSGLPPRQRACVVLRYYEDLADAEIAEALGCSVGTVRSNISRALAALRIDFVATDPAEPTTIRLSPAVPKES